MFLRVFRRTRFLCELLLFMIMSPIIRKKEWFLWLIIPLITLILPFIIRFLLAFITSFYILINISLTLISIYYCCLMKIQKIDESQLILMNLIPQLSLAALISPLLVVSLNENYFLLKSSLKEFFLEIFANEDIQLFLVIIQGILAIYVFLLGTRLKIKVEGDDMQNLRALMAIIGFFSPIFALLNFIFHEYDASYWAFRLSLLLLPCLIGVLAILMGFIYGKSNIVLKYLGTIIVFIIAFASGLSLIPFTPLGEIIFPCSIAFSYNCVLVIGLLAYILSHENCPLVKILKTLFI